MNINRPALTNLNANFVVLQGINQGNVFWTTNTPGVDPRFTHSDATSEGVLSYNIVAYTLTEDEAKAIWSMNIPAFLFKGLVSAGVRPYPE